MECTQLTTLMEMEAVITSPSTNTKINKYQTQFSLVKFFKDKALVQTEMRLKNPIFVPLLPPP